MELGRAAALLPLALAGCVSIALEGNRDGLPIPADKVNKLVAGKSTLHDALSELGPPSLIVRYGEVDRFYYVSWDNLNFKFSISAPLPVGRSVSTDAFILGLGAEELRLILLEFDRRDVLRDVRVGAFGQSSDGQYFAIDNRVVETFLEDRTRAMTISQDDDDDDDVERPPKK